MLWVRKNEKPYTSLSKIADGKPFKIKENGHIGFSVPHPGYGDVSIADCIVWDMNSSKFRTMSESEKVEEIGLMTEVYPKLQNNVEGNYAWIVTSHCKPAKVFAGDLKPGDVFMFFENNRKNPCMVIDLDDFVWMSDCYRGFQAYDLCTHEIVPLNTCAVSEVVPCDFRFTPYELKR